MPIRLIDPSGALPLPAAHGQGLVSAHGQGLVSAHGQGLGPSGMAARLSHMAGTLMDQRNHHHHRHSASASASASSSLPPPPPTSNNNNTASGGSGGGASNALIAQLLDMGFPPSWCVRAMEATNNDVDAALRYWHPTPSTPTPSTHTPSAPTPSTPYPLDHLHESTYPLTL